ncbi:hypothetical protein SAMN03159382_02235 [Pseudomonas sp. NFACC23-1]|uniref:hypothetical protein n=1 Tax=unclassified Pseudomonas TaxID=196821 RepID=UPI0008822114|nr:MULTISPECIES: hypothetical protein [unclassified Pseudomonas]SDB26564.1 hypothetical protein SAMN03159386_01901 [Pseudomonas sp. NFACC17-2]SEJ37717.1 hypothetical protein SAMN03159382_02235 [Pseudomonas sp. NFACC23-1]SFW54997.1 hypothetical protein SAMN05660640_01946 [Pseudomonas sp. NFACC16-2]
MSFGVLGFYPGKDELVFEQSISLSVADLKPVMQWLDGNDHIGADFRLSTKQVLEIERLTLLAFPRGLDLYLTSYG